MPVKIDSRPSKGFAAKIATNRDTVIKLKKGWILNLAVRIKMRIKARMNMCIRFMTNSCHVFIEYVFIFEGF